MGQERKVYKLKGRVQHYAWGGGEFLPGLLSVENPEHKPFAEYWMGAHENAPSMLEGASEAIQDGKVPLNQYLRERPVERLGVIEEGRAAFSRGRGECFAALYHGKFELKATADVVLYRAAVPVTRD